MTWLKRALPAVAVAFLFATPTAAQISGRPFELSAGAGSLKYDIRRYAVCNVIGSIGWAAMLLSLGYFFGHTAFVYLRQFRAVGLTVFFVICSVAALVALKEFGNVFLKRVRREVREEGSV